jgi:glycosyltransferase involved in cell wall biosynthesis
VRPRVLFVSKPVAPPFHDGTKCLVRDVATHLTLVDPIVMSSAGAPRIEASDGCAQVETVDVYRGGDRFSPGLAQNLRAAAWLLSRSDADVWHFVFAPNPRSSAVGRWLSRIRGAPVVQTIASPPKSFEQVERLLFGQIVVAQSRWTKDQIGSSRRLEVIPPPAPALPKRSTDKERALRRTLEIGEHAPIFVYPGDLETSSGAERVAAAVDPIVAEIPDAIIVFAYRDKTPRAAPIARALAGRLDPGRVRFTNNLPNVLTLVATSAAVLFPVDDLWGKVDLPIVLLEAMSLGVPVVVLDQGPLCDLRGVVRIAPEDDTALVREAIALLRETAHRSRVIEAQKDAIFRYHRAEVVARAYERLYLEVKR